MKTRMTVLLLGVLFLLSACGAGTEIESARKFAQENGYTNVTVSRGNPAGRYGCAYGENALIAEGSKDGRHERFVICNANDWAHKFRIVK